MRLKSLFILIALLLVSVSTALLAGAAETEAEQSLPSAYCMRDDYVVLAQNQDDHGYCWNFASTMAISTTIMKATGEYYDFSELWHGIACYELGAYSKLGAGGTFSYVSGVINKGGLMLECDLPYQESYTVSNENADDYFNFYFEDANTALASTVVSDSTTRFNRASVDAIKEHILNHGSIYMAFSFRKGFVEGAGAYYLPPNQKNPNSNHAISVVGWDDDYEMEVYLEDSETPTTYKGAWLVLNSYTETSGTDGLSYIFYEDTNISTTLYGFRYEPATDGDLYFYDKIEQGYAYPTSVIGKYYGDFTAESGVTKQRNIFYDDVALEYSYTVSEGADVEDVRVYLGDLDVTDAFEVSIDRAAKRFSITADDADYGQYKVLVTYGDGERSDTYLNNFYVTYGLLGEGTEYNYAENVLGFNTGRDLEFYSYSAANKNYVIYTDSLSGTVSFKPIHQSVYSDKNMSIPSISYSVTDGVGTREVYTVTSESGYGLDYVFNVEYYSDTTLQPVVVYYDLGGGVNHPKNYGRELASEESDLILYEPTREGYTFAGWYLDYGNGTAPIRSEGGVSYVDWDDIHHMGESPTLNATKAYGNYYKNSNTLFVYAHWVEEEYSDVRINVEGSGRVQVSDHISVSSEDRVMLLFKPEKSWCLASVEINGRALTADELLTAMDHGYVLEGVTEDTAVDVTFAYGTFLDLDLGENVKTAYLQREYLGQTVSFYHGDVIPYAMLSNGVSTYYNFTLVVVVADDCGGYTYAIDNGNYSPYSKGVFYRSYSVYKSREVNSIPIPSAVAYRIEERTVSYTVGTYVADHYISKDMNATSGERLSARFNVGEVAYLFIRTDADLGGYTYTLPTAYEPIGDNWYRRAVLVTPDTGNIGRTQPTRSAKTYTVTWRNWDGSVIYTSKHKYGETPVYNYDRLGTGTPIFRPTINDIINDPIDPPILNNDFDAVKRSTTELRASIIYPEKLADDIYTYVFVGWTPEIVAVTEDTSYTAVFEPVPKEFNVTVIHNENGAVASDKMNPVTYFDTVSLIFRPDVGYEVTDVIINGVSVGAVSSYTLSGVLCDQTVEVKFERIRYSVSITCGAGGTADIIGVTEIAHGDALTLNIIPDLKLAVEYITVNGVYVDPTELLSIESVTEDTVIEIGFVRVGVGITLSGEETILNIGDSYRLDIPEREGYRVCDVRIDGVSVGAVGHYTFTALDRDHTVEVDYEALKHSVHLVTEGEGSVTADKALDGIAHGESLTLTLTHGRLARVLCVLVNGEPVALDGGILFIDTETEITVDGITADTEITVIFEDLTVFVITAAVAALGLLTVIVLAIILGKRRW